MGEVWEGLLSLFFDEGYSVLSFFVLIIFIVFVIEVSRLFVFVVVIVVLVVVVVGSGILLHDFAIGFELMAVHDVLLEIEEILFWFEKIFG